MRTIKLLRVYSLLLILSFLLFISFSLMSSPTPTRPSKNSNMIGRNTIMRLTNDAQFLSPTIIDVAEKVKEIDFSAPVEWGENVTGVITRLPTDERLIALTFDACGGPYGSRYDQELMNFLIEEEIKATLFFNYRWIQTNLDEFLYLAGLDQFQIANHGTEHRPLSVNGARAWGINGTNSVEEVIDEVMINYEFVKELTGIEMKFYRSGTAFYDEVAVEIVQHLGMSVINYDILGDAGATFSANDVQKALLSSRPGSIVLLHMNQPSSGTAEGVRKAIPMLREQGFRFVTLDEVDGI